MARKKIRSLIDDVAVKVEMQPVELTSDKVLTPDELEQQIDEARKGKAKVDSKYVGNGDGLEHLFDYSYDYAKFLDSISYIIKKGK